MLEPLRCGQQRRVNHGRTQGIRNSTHPKADSVHERGAGVLHKVPAIGDLNSIAQPPGHSLAVAAARSRDMTLIPGCWRSQTSAAACSDQATTPLLVCVHYCRRWCRSNGCSDKPKRRSRPQSTLGPRQGASTHNPKQRVVADRQHGPSGKRGIRSAARCQAEMMNDLLEPPRAPGALGQNRHAEPLVVSDALPTTDRGLADVVALDTI